MPQRALHVADPRRPQGDLLDRALGLAEIDDVADAELVLDHHERAGEEVAHDVSGTEAEGDAERCWQWRSRRQVDVEDTQDRQRATNQMTMVARLRNTVVRVWARASVRIPTSAVFWSTVGVAWRSTRRARRRSGSRPGSWPA